MATTIDIQQQTRYSVTVASADAKWKINGTFPAGLHIQYLGLERTASIKLDDGVEIDDLKALREVLNDLAVYLGW